MVKKLFGIAACSLLMTGCATTRAPSDMGKLQIQVAQLERQMDERSGEVADLKDRVSQLEGDVQTLEPYPAEESSNSHSFRPTGVSSSKGVSSSTDEIVRVAASAEQVQRALKNAGYYDGVIDGNIGSGTKKAIVNFQKDHDLTSDGVIGRKTWNELKTYQ